MMEEHPTTLRKVYVYEFRMERWVLDKEFEGKFMQNRPRSSITYRYNYVTEHIVLK